MLHPQWGPSSRTNSFETGTNLSAAPNPLCTLLPSFALFPQVYFGQLKSTQLAIVLSRPFSK